MEKKIDVIYTVFEKKKVVQAKNIIFNEKGEFGSPSTSIGQFEFFYFENYREI